MAQDRSDVKKAFSEFKRDSLAPWLAEGDAERKTILARFPREAWPSLPLEMYALGLGGDEDTYCSLLEFRSQHLGSIRGGSARKLLIYKHRDKEGWYFERQYANEQEAWKAVRAGFARLLDLGAARDWAALEDRGALRNAPALSVKTLHIYYPEEILPIASRAHLLHFLAMLEREEARDTSWDVVRLNRALLAACRELLPVSEWRTNEIERFLYWWADPRTQSRVVKIAPGDDAKYWEDCFANGYICVGWDELGDLQQYDSRDAFRARFEEIYGGKLKGNAKHKAGELWTLMELEPGDLVVANKGISQILGVGEVVEPGYSWRPDREHYRHTISVKWDTSYARQIPPQKRWAFQTVAEVPAALWASFTRRDSTLPAAAPPAAPPRVVAPDPLHAQVADALERRKQVILYGPPGTGKTFTARRFSVWWLLKKAGSSDADAVLANPVTFLDAERQLAGGQASRRVWWVVASPKEWTWDRLFKEHRVTYRQGRIARNYPNVQVGDLVVGYQSTPDKKIVALARVSNPRAQRAGDDWGVELEPVASLANGPDYDELAKDPILSKSEPMRFRNQGTLFSLTGGEAEHLLEVLRERHPDIEGALDDGTRGGSLTRITFHPSYSYEDFVEGFRPYDNGSGTLALRLEPGVFKRICALAMAHPARAFLVLIDEINRANVAKVFGELITILESDKRDLPVVLPQSKESFRIPENVYLIGTMNTADRSIRLLDAALRRRFAFVEIPPDPALLAGGRAGDMPLDQFLSALNRRIAEHVGSEKQIGHSFFLDKEEAIDDIAEFGRRFREEVLPLLQEYCYDDASALAGLIGTRLVDPDTGAMDEDVLHDDESLAEALADELLASPSPAL